MSYVQPWDVFSSFRNRVVMETGRYYSTSSASSRLERSNQKQLQCAAFNYESLFPIQVRTTLYSSSAGGPVRPAVNNYPVIGWSNNCGRFTRPTFHIVLFYFQQIHRTYWMCSCCSWMLCPTFFQVSSVISSSFKPAYLHEFLKICRFYREKKGLND